MSGIFLAIVVPLWFWITVRLTRMLVSRIGNRLIRMGAAIAAFGCLLVLPVIDELIGWRQFESLCQQYSTQEIDVQNARNRRVSFELPAKIQYVKGTAVPIRIDPNVYRDVETNRVIVSYHTLHAKGGWLIRALNISEVDAPLLFRRACAPGNEDEFKKKFNITVVN